MYKMFVVDNIWVIYNERCVKFRAELDKIKIGGSPNLKNDNFDHFMVFSEISRHKKYLLRYLISRQSRL